MQIDLSTPTGLLLSILPELFLSAWSLVIVLVTAWKHGSDETEDFIGRLSIAGLCVTVGMVLWQWGAGMVGSGVMGRGAGGPIALDGFRYVANIAILLAGIFGCLLSLGYTGRERIRIPEYYALILMSVVGMMFMVGSNDLIIIFIALELMSVSVYVLAGINRRSLFSAEAALKYFLLGAFASAFFLYGIAMLYGATGSTNVGVMGLQLDSIGVRSELMLNAGVALLLIGFGFKVAAIPFHMWAPDVYDGAPTPITAFMATAVKAAGFAALIRVFLTAFGDSLAIWQNGVWWLAAITMIGGNLLALSQTRLKRMLAYSSVGHAGYIMVALASGTQLGAGAFIFYIMAYTLMTVGAFAVLASAGTGGEREVMIDSLSGLASRKPWVAFAMSVFMLSLLGFPGTAGFVGKWFILSAALDAGLPSLSVVLVVASLISAGYYLPVIRAMYMKAPANETSHDSTILTGPARFVVAVATAALLLFGFWPGRAMDVARVSGESLGGSGQVFTLDR